jgi:hypothetical protein
VTVRVIDDDDDDATLRTCSALDANKVGSSFVLDLHLQQQQQETRRASRRSTITQTPSSGVHPAGSRDRDGGGVLPIVDRLLAAIGDRVDGEDIYHGGRWRSRYCQWGEVAAAMTSQPSRPAWRGAPAEDGPERDEASSCRRCRVGHIVTRMLLPVPKIMDLLLSLLTAASLFSRRGGDMLVRDYGTPSS